MNQRDLYLAEFTSRRRRATESWADLAEDHRRLATTAYPDLNNDATEQIALTQFIASIVGPQISFAVKQRIPKAFDECHHTIRNLPDNISADSGYPSNEHSTRLLTTITTKLEDLESPQVG